MQKHLDSFSVRTTLVESAAIMWRPNMHIVTTVTAPVPHAVHQLADAPARATGQVRAGRARRQSAAGATGAFSCQGVCGLLGGIDDFNLCLLDRYGLQWCLSMAVCLLRQVLQPFVDMDLSSVYFSDFHKLDINGIPCYLTRTGCVLSGFSSLVFSCAHRTLTSMVQSAAHSGRHCCVAPEWSVSCPSMLQVQVDACADVSACGPAGTPARMASSCRFRTARRWS